MRPFGHVRELFLVGGQKGRLLEWGGVKEKDQSSGIEVALHSLCVEKPLSQTSKGGFHENTS